MIPFVIRNSSLLVGSNGSGICLRAVLQKHCLCRPWDHGDLCSERFRQLRGTWSLLGSGTPSHLLSYPLTWNNGTRESWLINLLMCRDFLSVALGSVFKKDFVLLMSPSVPTPLLPNLHHLLQKDLEAWQYLCFVGCCSSAKTARPWNIMEYHLHVATEKAVTQWSPASSAWINLNKNYWVTFIKT